MKRTAAFTFLVLALLVSAVYIIRDPSQGGALLKSAAINEYDETMKRDLLCLFMAYPEYVKDVEKTEAGMVYLIMKSGQRLVYDDKKDKTMEQKMENPDLQDMLEQPYPLRPIRSLMETDFDPGRIRVYPLLKEVYGTSQKQIEEQLSGVRVGGQALQFSKNNSASEALEQVMKELAPLAQSNAKIAAAAFPSSGTYNYRYISKTNRLSPHAFGIAIDLARDSRDYWQWATREQGEKRLQAYPQELVGIFERNNFVWGGKWGHFDILHFEYRPEIILKAAYFGNGHGPGAKWYEGAPEDAAVSEAIAKIEAALD